MASFGDKEFSQQSKDRGQSGPKRHSSPILTLPFVSMEYTLSIGYYYTMKSGCYRDMCNQVETADIRC